MTTEDDLLEAVRREPADDTVRLAYADFLEENNRLDQAAFIRVQIEKANHPGMNCGQLYCSERGPEGLCDSCWQYKQLKARDWDLYETLGAAEAGKVWGLPPGWRTLRRNQYPPRLELPEGFVAPSSPSDRFVAIDRGFPYAVCCTAEALREGAAELFRHPIEEFTLLGAEPFRADGEDAASWYGDEDAAPWYDIGVDVYRRDGYQVSDLPTWLFGLLGEIGVCTAWTSRHMRTYSSAELAASALEKACLLYGRREYENEKSRGREERSGS